MEKSEQSYISVASNRAAVVGNSVVIVPFSPRRSTTYMVLLLVLNLFRLIGLLYKEGVPILNSLLLYKDKKKSYAEIILTIVIPPRCDIPSRRVTIMSS